MEWFEDEALWVDFSAVFFSAERAAAAEATVASSPLLDVPAGTEVLDLGCGPGTFTLPLARRGATVTGVDLSQALLDRARREAAEASVDVRLVRADMREFVEPDRFDLAISMYTSFGLFTEHGQNMRVLHNALASLAPGGRLLIDLFCKEVLARDGGEAKIFDVEGGTLTVRGTVLEDWTRFRDDFVLVRGNRARTAFVEHTLYSAVELKALLGEAGFVDVVCYGGFGGEPFDNHARRLIVVGSRPATDRDDA
ncbi:class I SAM-dependent methyltransferase [Streptomyces litchfieldiae]|uniref:Class I SAM-dependent methyltransferase n=1 Tax=Streptomyces litchfieldiae TaxID=3075543 RepID=A0ABU2N4M3_9ACTN|nr:class I SAM-dependent methyltransferase [Streptomyces sp. DSM 44938]MDT0347679.1 class I SAM-dependent methyltransferase [Streptomyces sp. DSM 44938]